MSVPVSVGRGFLPFDREACRATSARRLCSSGILLKFGDCVARLESVWAPKGSRGFESHPIRSAPIPLRSSLKDSLRTRDLRAPACTGVACRA